jgi:hypothetical protein
MSVLDLHDLRGHEGALLCYIRTPHHLPHRFHAEEVKLDDGGKVA